MTTLKETGTYKYTALHLGSAGGAMVNRHFLESHLLVRDAAVRNTMQSLNRTVADNARYSLQ
jgi:hypothetical protein